MNTEEIVERYIDAWNTCDVDAMLALMHPGVAYYDAYWMETCVGRDLPTYLRDSLSHEHLWYERVGDIITTPHGVVFRYNARAYSAGQIGDVIFNGAEILRIREDRILTVSDIYCNPAEANLVELAKLTAVRHGLTRHANDGLSAYKAAHIVNRLSASLENDSIYRDPDLTLAALADIVGCTEEQLTTVLASRYHTDLGSLLDRHRIEYAKQLLLGEPDSPRFIDEVAANAGFRSASDFRNRFIEIVGVTPKAYRLRQRHPGLPD